MHDHFTCDVCGEAGSVSVEEGADLPACPRCGGTLSIERPGDHVHRAIQPGELEDEIVAWVLQSAESSGTRPGGDSCCPECGYSGPMTNDTGRRLIICPACMMVQLPRVPPGYRTIECPGCRQVVEYSDLDRGRTILCKACKYFLGCLVPPEKHTYRARRGSRLR